ncbi:MAG: K(+)-transporting ATPase subunit C [Deltaproteobacteria bacterium]|nr:K(+)-transporting ATPase subunit C [Deltaproteobacteria bacterium]
MNSLISQIRISLVATIVLAVILCGVYPALIWGVAQALFPNKANGSLVIRNGKIIGSELIAQNFTDAKYFHPRPSSAGDVGYDATSSGGSNLGPTSKKLIDLVRQRVDTYRSENNLPQTILVPADAVTSSASGLDPHISLKNALLQAPRVAKTRGIDEKALVEKIQANTDGRDMRILGEPRVNVLTLNLSLDAS